MKNILILGANGRIARIVEHRLLNESDVKLTLVLRNASRLAIAIPAREKLIEGDVNDLKLLDVAMSNQDVVYVNLAGNMELAARSITKMMNKHAIKQLIWITGSGLYHETPGPFGSWVEKVVGHAAKNDTRRAAKVIEESELQYTIIRAAYMTDESNIDYDLTQKGELFKGTMVSRASIADLILKIIFTPKQYVRASLGISKPGTDNLLPQIKIMAKTQ
ncbi:NAD(P)H-binding protein [Lactiplantibacillus sp. WILCCON 0030]|uniref:NAD(P)H-binding protein n=1 Tax=Lactiplantibacillus brownii TaxID=3069269 RepID=A0ABU1A9Q1_9LACO|nr:NAD(P)H-binding protein [Lactiplantibacillus brownii]MDQ7937697.1 NAD(P)H-binding protein [Lactiplantibacillus brownii]